MWRAFLTLIIGLSLSGCAAAEGDQIELGTVEWLRDYPAAQQQARESGKPILILFQEVPG